MPQIIYFLPVFDYFAPCYDAVTMACYNKRMEPTTATEPAHQATPLRRLARTALRQIAADAADAAETVRTHTVFDPDNDHYLLVAEGWQGYRRVYRTLAHLALCAGVLHIYEDGTIEGIAARLRAVGVPPENIICEWTTQPPPKNKKQKYSRKFPTYRKMRA